MEKEKSWFRVVLIAVLVISLVFLFFENATAITGHATTGDTTSNVTIQKYLSITFGANLEEGIYFGSVDTLPADDINASHNYDGASSATTYNITVSDDGNTAIDFCLRANAGLTNAAADVIGLANETYSNSSSTNLTLPALANQISMTTSYVKSGDNIAQGESNHYRFWLDIVAAQASGDYNNSVSFKGVQTGSSC
jgi:hypothetical protein